jgi:hypothetical protein
MDGAAGGVAGFSRRSRALQTEFGPADGIGTGFGNSATGIVTGRGQALQELVEKSFEIKKMMVRTYSFVTRQF